MFATSDRSGSREVNGPDVPQRSGLPLPSLWQVVGIAAALVGSWLVWTKFGRISEDMDRESVGNPVRNLHSVEAFVRAGADAIPELTKSLDSVDPYERSLAAYGLGRIGPAAVDTLPKILDCLIEGDPRIRERAVFAVARISPDKNAAATAIGRLLSDSESSVREVAGRQLLLLGSSSFSVIVQALHSDQQSVRLQAIRLLRQTGAFYENWRHIRVEVNEAILGAADDPDSAVRIEAISGAAERGQASAEQIRYLWQSNDARNRELALSAIRRLEDSAIQFFPDVLALLDDKPALDLKFSDGRMFRSRFDHLLDALTAMKTGARPATERLVAMSKQRGCQDCLQIARTLDVIGADDADIAGVLQPWLWSKKKNEAWPAGELLVKIRPQEARRQVSLLIPRLGSNEMVVDTSVLYAIYALGPQAHEAVPALIPLLKNPDKWVAEFAAHALGSSGIGSESAAVDLATVVANRSLPVEQRIAAADALRKIGPASRDAVAELLKVIAEPEPVSPVRDQFLEWRLRITIIGGLGRIGGDHADVIAALRSQLLSTTPEVRAATVEALGHATKTAADVLPDLIQHLRDADADTQAQAAMAIGRLPIDRSTAVDPLLHFLDDVNPFLRVAAAKALGEIGLPAKAALDALQKAVSDPDNSRDLATYLTANRGQPLLRQTSSFEIGKTIAQFAREAIEKIEAVKKTHE